MKFIKAKDAQNIIERVTQEEELEKREKIKQKKNKKLAENKNSKLNEQLNGLLLQAAINNEYSILWKSEIPNIIDLMDRGFNILTLDRYSIDEIEKFAWAWESYHFNLLAEKCFLLSQKSIDTQFENEIILIFENHDNFLNATRLTTFEIYKEIHNYKVNYSKNYSKSEILELYLEILSSHWLSMSRRGKIIKSSIDMHECAIINGIKLESSIIKWNSEFFDCLFSDALSSRLIIDRHSEYWMEEDYHKCSTILGKFNYNGINIFQINAIEDKEDLDFDDYFEGYILLPPYTDDSDFYINIFPDINKYGLFKIQWKSEAQNLPSKSFRIDKNILNWLNQKAGTYIVKDIFSRIERAAYIKKRSIKILVEPDVKAWCTKDSDDNYKHIAHPEILKIALSQYGYNVNMKPLGDSFELTIAW